MFHKLLITTILATNAASQAFAAMAYDFTTPAIDFTNNIWSIGFEFDVTTPFLVNGLGFYDDGKNDLTESHDVGIYNSSGTLLVSGTVAPGDTLISWFRWTSVTPTLLPVGTGYRVAAATGSENYTWGPIGFSTDPAITFVVNRYDQSGTLVFPTNSSGFSFQGYFGPNFSGDAVPEPGTLAMCALGLIAGLSQVRRARRS